MADIALNSPSSTGSAILARSIQCLVYTSASDGYVFYADLNSDLLYSKTTDGGQSWGGGVTVRTGTVNAFCTWFDRWTPGDSGNIIHIWYGDTGTDLLYYRSLDTSTDTLGTEQTVYTGTTLGAGRGTIVSGTKARGGNLLCTFALDANGNGERGTYRSTDGGSTWSSRASLGEAITAQRFLLFPGNESDNQDIWCLYLDATANTVTLKTYDDSANSVSESSSIVTVADNITDGTGQYPIAGAIRHSDGHLIAVVYTEYDSATGDFNAYDINGAGSITFLTALATNVDDTYYPAVYIDNATDDIYVGYSGKLDGTETITTSVNVYYAKSTNGGTSWTSNIAYSEDAAANNRQIWAPLGGDRFAIAWRNGTANFRTNYNNSLDLTPAAGSITGPLVGIGHLLGRSPLVGGRLIR